MGTFLDMMDLVAIWNSDAFHEELTGWLDNHLTMIGMERRGPLVSARVRFWSGVFHAAVTGQEHRRVWVKVGNPGQTFEGALLRGLGRVVPDQVVRPMVVDDSRGWWVLPDGGPTVRESAAQELGTVWGDLLHQTARLQRRVAARRAELSAVPALPLGDVIQEVDSRLSILGSRDPGDPQHLSTDALQAARAGLRRPEASITTLSRLGIPDTLQPNDVSPSNAFLPRTPGGPYRLFDMGDAFWSHPFGVLHLPLRLAAGSSLADPLPDRPDVRRLAEQYLRCWPEVPVRRWPEVLEAADRLGAVHRALSWERLLAHVDARSLTDPPRVSVWFMQALAPSSQGRTTEITSSGA